jgi:hypothetical protein
MFNTQSKTNSDGGANQFFATQAHMAESIQSAVFGSAPAHGRTVRRLAGRF